MVMCWKSFVQSLPWYVVRKYWPSCWQKYDHPRKSKKVKSGHRICRFWQCYIKAEILLLKYTPNIWRLLFPTQKYYLKAFPDFVGHSVIKRWLREFKWGSSGKSADSDSNIQKCLSCFPYLRAATEMTSEALKGVHMKGQGLGKDLNRMLELQISS